MLLILRVFSLSVFYINVFPNTPSSRIRNTPWTVEKIIGFPSPTRTDKFSLEGQREVSLLVHCISGQDDVLKTQLCSLSIDENKQIFCEEFFFFLSVKSPAWFFPFSLLMSSFPSTQKTESICFDRGRFFFLFCVLCFPLLFASKRILVKEMEEDKEPS